MNPRILVLSFVALLAAQSSFAGIRMNCQVTGKFKSSENSAIPVPIPTLDEGGLDAGIAIADIVTAYCMDQRGNGYSMNYIGVGAALRFVNSWFTVSCPLVSKKRLTKGYAGFVGAKVSATFIGGVEAGIFTNELLGVCVLGGVHTGLGASASVGYMFFE